MKHFTITTEEQAEALSAFRAKNSLSIKVGDIVTPESGAVHITHWKDYPEAYAITFEECMSIVKDEVTKDVLMDLRESLYFENPHPFEGEKWIGFDLFAEWDKDAIIQMGLQSGRVTFNGIEIPNPTATKLRLLVKILKGE